ncbi:MAG: DMT family transporter [Coriobacteriia bacterium]|nr:DMT family transporter [Coriobacteriia bacterium]
MPSTPRTRPDAANAATPAPGPAADPIAAPAPAGPPLQAVLLVFLGGACYGFNATCYKIAYSWGFASAQVAAAQMWFAFALCAVALAGERLLGRRWTRLGPATAAKLAAIGLVSCGTSITYTYAMSVLPVPLALTMLFQFTWMGTVIQVAMTRRPPAVSQVVSAAIIVVGTVFASGLYATDLSSVDLTGIAAGLAAAFCCALFLALSGRIQPACSQAQRGFLICGGAVLGSHLFCPDFIVSGVLLQGIAPVGLVMGACGFFLPVILFSLGTPHLPTGLSAVLSASELPAGLLVAMLVLGEPLGAAEWAGVAVILAGVCVSQLQFLPRRGGSDPVSGS